MKLRQVIAIGPMSVQFVPVFFEKANTEVGVAHALPRVPIGWTVASVDKFCKIKDGQMPRGLGAIQLVSDTDGVNAVIRVEGLNLSER